MEDPDMMALAASTFTPPELLEKVYKNGGDKVKAMVAANIACPKKLVELAAAHPDEEVRAGAAGSGNLDEKWELALAGDPSNLITRRLAEATESADVLSILCKHPDGRTRYAVAENKHTSNSTLRELSGDPEPPVSNEARSAGRGRGLDVPEPLDVVDLLAGLEEPKFDPAERPGLVNSPDVEKRKILAGLDDLTVSEAQILSKDSDDAVVLELAKRKDLDENLALGLLAHGSHRVRAYACLRAPVDEAEKLVGDHEAVRAMLARVAQDPQVQVTLSKDSNSTVRLNLASQARNLCEEAVVNLSGDELSTTRKVVVLNSLHPGRYDNQNIADLVAWREECWQEELAARLGDNFSAVEPFLDDFPGTFRDLQRLSETLV